VYCQKIYINNYNKGPFEYQLSEPLIVAPEGHADVDLLINHHFGGKMGGVSFYGVRLVPVPSSSNPNASVQATERATCGIQ
jgi:hypothetical protein